MRVRDHKKEDASRVNRENTVGICPVRNAAGQKPVAKLQAGFLEHAAKVAAVEYGTPHVSPVVYLWAIDTGDIPWVGLSHNEAGQYPEEAIIIAGRGDPADGTIL